MSLEPRFFSEQTEQIVENRHFAIELYKREPEAFHVQLEFDAENAYDENAVVVFAEGKVDRYFIGYISRSFNIRIGKLLAENAFPFIQTNYGDILNGAYSADNVILDIYF